MIVIIRLSFLFLSSFTLYPKPLFFTLNLLFLLPLDPIPLIPFTFVFYPITYTFCSLFSIERQVLLESDSFFSLVMLRKVCPVSLLSYIGYFFYKIAKKNYSCLNKVTQTWRQNEKQADSRKCFKLKTVR